MRKIIIFFTTIILLSSCGKNNSPVAGKHYKGYWKHISYLYLHFENDSIVKAREVSAEVVGMFTDEAKGHYSLHDSTIVICLTEGNSDNISLTDYPIVDTFVANHDFSILTEHKTLKKESDTYIYKLEQYRPSFLFQHPLVAIMLILSIVLAIGIVRKKIIKKSTSNSD